MVWTNKRNIELLDRARKVIPAGMYGHCSTVLLPEEYPQFITRAKGCRIWDADGNEYIDYVNGYGTNLLGYGYEPVEAAAEKQRALCDTTSLPSQIMVELAEKFVSMISHASWTMFCKNGTDATSMAIVVARAHTSKRKILVAHGAYHGAAPWCTPLKFGVTAEDRAHIIYYDYNSAESLEAAFHQAGDDLAGVIATPFRHDTFRDEELVNVHFAKTARRLCDRAGALLIVDEVRAGFRLGRDCSWSLLGVDPDLSTWGKSFANGHPISALLGSELARGPAQQIFVTGTFWFNAVPMAAGIATLNEIKNSDYLERIERSARMLREGLARQAKAHGFGLKQTGPIQMPMILFENDPDFRIGFCWATEALKRGVYLHPWHNNFISAAHSEADIERTLEVTDIAFAELKKRQTTLEPVVKIAMAASLEDLPPL
jgi:glutamate-1-semialdehyde 2,1-aminomutase